MNIRRGYRFKEGKERKSRLWWCGKCPYTTESVTEAAIKRHIIIKHEASPTPLKNGIKRYRKDTNESMEKEGEGKKPKRT